MATTENGMGICQKAKNRTTVWPISTTPGYSVQFSSVIQSCLTLCDPVNCSTPGLPVHHQLPESTQTHVHWVSDAIQPSHPLSSPSPPALNLSQHQGLFKWVSSWLQVAKVLEFQLQHQSLQWTPRTDLLQDGLVGSPCSPRDYQESFPSSHVQMWELDNKQGWGQKNWWFQTTVLKKTHESPWLCLINTSILTSLNKYNKQEQCCQLLDPGTWRPRICPSSISAEIHRFSSLSSEQL